MKKEQLLRFYQNYKLFIFPAVVALSSLLLIIFAIYPQTVKLISNQRSQRELINKSQFLENKVLALESYDEQDLARQVGLVLNAYPADKDLGVMVGLLQQLVTQSGFIINSIAMSNISNKSAGAQSYDVKLDLSGLKDGFSILLNNLEGSPRLIRVNNIDISSTSGSGAINVSLVLEVLYSQIPQNFGTADSPLPELSQKDEELLVRLARFGGEVSQPQVISVPRGKDNPFE